MSSEDIPASTGPKSGLRPWRPGQSGNPNGRRAKGLVTAERLRNALVKELPDILEGVVKAAKSGDLQAARTILERVLPPLKAIEVPAVLEPLTGTLSEQGQSVLAAMANGALTPGQTTQLLAALASQAKLLEADELNRRLSELEKKVGVTDANR